MTEESPFGLIFPGQGTQKQGMGEPWRDTAAWTLVGDISTWSGVDVEELLVKADDERLRRTDLAQLAVFTVSVLALTEFSERVGDPARTPAAAAGRSLGEYVALVAAGALDLADAAALVAVRGRAMRAAAAGRAGTMAVLLTDVDTAAVYAESVRAAGFDVWVANINGPQQTVVAGAVDGVDAVADTAESAGVRVVRIPVGGAFHSPLMAPAAAELTAALRDAAFAPTHGVVVANVDSRPRRDGREWTDLLARQLTNPVRWAQSVHTLTVELGCRSLVELGPGRTLAGMIRRIDRDVEVIPADSPAAVAAAPLS